MSPLKANGTGWQLLAMSLKTLQGLSWVDLMPCGDVNVHWARLVRREVFAKLGLETYAERRNQNILDDCQIISLYDQLAHLMAVSSTTARYFKANEGLSNGTDRKGGWGPSGNTGGNLQ